MWIKSIKGKDMQRRLFSIGFGVCLAGWFGVLPLCADTAPVGIVGFDSVKMLYDFDENVELHGIVSNSSPHDVQVTAECVVLKGVDQSFPADTRVTTIPAGKEIPLRFRWNPEGKEYGFSAFLTLKTSEGNVLARSDPAIFEVCHDWRKLSRLAVMCVFHDFFNPDSPKSSPENRQKVIRHLRSIGYNVVEFFGPWHPTIDNLSPEEEVWPFCFHQDPTASQTRQTTRVSADLLKTWIQEFHQAGIKVIGYFHTPTYAIHDESWRVYEPGTGKFMHYDGNMRRVQWLDENSLGVPNILKFTEEYGKKLAVAVEEFDWDGYFFDSFVQLAQYTARGVDKHGHPLTDRSVGDLFGEGVRNILTPVHAVKDNFTFIANGLHIALAGQEYFPSRDMFGADGRGFPFRDLPDTGFVFNFESQDPRNRSNTPWQIGRSLRAVRELIKQPISSFFYIASPPAHAKTKDEDLSWTYRPETIKPFMAVLLANGVGYNNYFGGNLLPSPAKDPVARGIASYLNFAARYGEYLYDLNLHWTPKDRVHVKAPDHVYWKGNTFQREFEDRTEVYVHLINYDRMYLAAKLWDSTRTVPPPVANIPVTVRVPETCRGVRAFVVRADGDQSPLELPVTVDAGQATFIVPELEYWSLAVLQIETSEGGDR